MKRLAFALLMVAGLLFASTTITRAQTYDISWHTIAGGGGTSSGGNYSVSGTIGQSDAGTLSGGNYTLVGGFWGIIAAIQTPGAPFLYITNASTPNHVVVSWAVNATGFRLQQEPNLATPSWLAVNTNSTPVVVTNGFNTVTVPVSGNQYFRLINP